METRDEHRRISPGARLGCGLVLMACALTWHVAIGPRWTQRIPPGWSWSSHFVGIQTWPDPRTEALPERDAVALFDRSMSLRDDDGRSAVVHVDDEYVTRDPATGNVAWTEVTSAAVDRHTGARRDSGLEGEQFLFPREVERRSYVLRNGRLKGVPLVFERDDEIDGLLTYVFAYTGPGVFTDIYARADDEEGVRVAPGEEIRCADDQYVHRAWVEPLTGETVKIQESCYSGDYIFDRASGLRLAPVDRFASVMTGDSVLHRVHAARSARARYLLAGRLVPGGLVALGIALLLAACIGYLKDGIATTHEEHRHAA